MNKVILSGKITTKISKKGTAEAPIAETYLEVKRFGSKDNKVDTFRIVGYNDTAKNMASKLKKDSVCHIVGRLKAGSYEKDGQKHYPVDVIVDRLTPDVEVPGLNIVCLQGRLSKEFDKSNGGNTTVAKSNLAVDGYSSKDKEKTADFYRLTAFGKTADNMEKFLGKGDQVVVDGRLQSGSYEKDGQTHETVDVIVDRFDFGAKAGNGSSKNSSSSADSSADGGWGEEVVDLPDSGDEDLDW